MSNWGTRLKAAIRAAGLSQSDVAEKMGCSRQAVSKWTAGGGIDSDKLKRLARILDTNWMVLAYGYGVDFPVKKFDRAYGLDVDVWAEVNALWSSVLSDGIKKEHIARTLLGKFDIGIWEYDVVTGVRFWSPTAKKVAGLIPSEKMCECMIQKNVLPVDGQKIANFYRTILIDKKDAATVVGFRRRPGVLLKIVGTPIVENDTVVKVMGFIFERGCSYDMLESTNG